MLQITVLERNNQKHNSKVNCPFNESLPVRLLLLTISPLSVSLLSQSFLSEVFILIFVPLPAEVILTGLEEKKKIKSQRRRIRKLQSHFTGLIYHKPQNSRTF